MGCLCLKTTFLSLPDARSMYKADHITTAHRPEPSSQEALSATRSHPTHLRSHLIRDHAFAVLLLLSPMASPHPSTSSNPLNFLRLGMSFFLVSFLAPFLPRHK